MSNLTLINNLQNIDSMITQTLTDILSVITSIITAISNLHSELNKFLNDIVLMTTDAQNGTLNGLPIYKSIGMIHYLAGDINFKIMYSVLLFGCLFTIYKLGLLLYSAIREYISGLVNSGMNSTVTGKIAGWFKK